MEVRMAFDTSGCVTPILNSILVIENLINAIESNSQQFHRLSTRLNMLEKLVLSIQEMERIKDSDDVRKALDNLQYALTEAKEKIMKFHNSKPLLKFVKSSHNETKFRDVNERLSDAYEELSGSLHVRQNQIQEELNKKQEERKCLVL